VSNAGEVEGDVHMCEQIECVREGVGVRAVGQCTRDGGGGCAVWVWVCGEVGCDIR